MAKGDQLAQWVRAKMKERHLESARALAKYSGLAPDTISRILLGARPKMETIEKLADYFGVPRDELMALAGYVENVNLFAQGGFQNLTEGEKEKVRRYVEELLRRRQSG